MNFIRGRLERLEERSRGGGCDNCGLPPNGHGRIVLKDDGIVGEGFPDDPGERCGSCGRSLWCVIKVVYDGAEGDGSEDSGGGGYRWP